MGLYNSSVAPGCRIRDNLPRTHGTLEPCAPHRFRNHLQLEGTDHLLGVHEPCIHNEFSSLLSRVVNPVPQPTRLGLQMLNQQADEMIRNLPETHPIPGDQLLSTFPRHKRKLYERVAKSLLEVPLTAEDAHLKSFVKCEMVEPSKDPRMIQARNPRYNWRLARFTRALEPKLYKIKHEGFRCIHKGLNGAQRARLLRAQWDLHENPAALSVDASRWDRHCHQKVLQVEHRVYLEKMPYRELRWLLEQQLTNVGRTQNGLRYQVTGGRMSGDMNTALGNCLLAVMMAKAALQALQIRAHIANDGDDLVLIGERPDVERIQERLQGIYLQFGQELKLEGGGLQTEFHQILFCQHKPNLSNGQWQMCPDPRKVLQTAMGVSGAYQVGPYLGTKLECRAILHHAQPYLGNLFARFATEYPQRLRSGLREQVMRSLDARLGQCTSWKWGHHPEDSFACAMYEDSWDWVPPSEMFLTGPNEPRAVYRFGTEWEWQGYWVKPCQERIRSMAEEGAVAQVLTCPLPSPTVVRVG